MRSIALEFKAAKETFDVQKQVWKSSIQRKQKLKEDEIKLELESRKKQLKAEMDARIEQVRSHSKKRELEIDHESSAFEEMAA